MKPHLLPLLAAALLALIPSVNAQLGTRFPSERKVVNDPITGQELVFLTSGPAGDSKIYPTHPKWTAYGEWVIFRSNRVKGEAMAVHETSGALVQVTEGGYMGQLCIAQKSMKLYITRDPLIPAGSPPSSRGGPTGGDRQIVEIDLARLFSDSEAGQLKPAAHYERICGIIPQSMDSGGDMDLDADEEVIYFRIGKEEAFKHLPEGTVIHENFGPRNMGAGPTGIAKMDLNTGAIDIVTAVGFQMGHLQTNPWVSGELVFCWETGGKAPQRTWTVRADGSGLRPLYPEADYEWVTHEAIITPDEVAMAIMGHREPGFKDAWGECGSREKPSGLAIVNLRTREMRIVDQTDSGSGHWHVHGSPDGNWACGDDFDRNLFLIDRHTGERMLLTTGHKETAADHVHPTFSRCGTRIQFQSAMLAEDNRSMSICVVRVPESWLARYR
jgi:oligogalacturonide lyase